MAKIARITVTFAIMLLALVGVFSPAHHASAQTASGACDTSASFNGSATPPYGTTGTTIVFRARGFQANEDVSFYFTLPNGDVIGTAAPFSGGINPDGTIGPLPFAIDQQTVNLATGRWAITFKGATSNNTAVIYFCVFTAAQATAAATTPTATTAPATATGVPATATTAATAAATNTAVPADTTVPVTSTVAVTAVASDTSVPATSVATDTAVVPTTVPATSTMVPAVPTTAPTTMPTMLPTMVPTMEPAPTMTGTGGVGGTTPGMPSTGQPEVPAYLTLFSIALGLLGLGVVARRVYAGKR